MINSNEDSKDITANNKAFKDLKVLYCDDDEFNLAYAEMILQGKVNYTLVSSGQKAVEKSIEEIFDVILMDIQMPEMDGQQAFTEIRARGKNTTTPIAAVTAQAMAGDKERLLSFGFNAYLAKPFKEEDLLQLIKICVFDNNS